MKALELLLLATAALAQSTSIQPESMLQTVVFVCEHGAAKSVIAAAHFNRLASGMSALSCCGPGHQSGRRRRARCPKRSCSEGLDVAAWEAQGGERGRYRTRRTVVSLATDLPAKKPSSSRSSWSGTIFRRLARTTRSARGDRQRGRKARRKLAAEAKK